MESLATMEKSHELIYFSICELIHIIELEVKKHTNLAVCVSQVFSIFHKLYYMNNSYFERTLKKYRNVLFFNNKSHMGHLLPKHMDTPETSAGGKR